LPRVACSLAAGVGEAYYTYNDAIMQIIHKAIYEDLDAWHGRCAIRALRMAALFASLDGTDEINLRHWARAQHIAERWRFSSIGCMSRSFSSRIPRRRAQRKQS
jgi:hypothetical protein